jgi:transcriptional regulator with XRE-family HTH domain
MTRNVTLLRAYLAQRGLFARVAKKLGFDPSYISRVANGKRKSKRVSQAIEADLKKTHTASQKAAQSSMKRLVFPASERTRRVSR